MKRSPERREVEAVEVPPIVLPELEALTAERRSASLGIPEDIDLEVPEGIEGPVPVFALPGNQIQLRFINLVLTIFLKDQGRGCPACYEDAPGDFQKLYCQAKTAYWAETRPIKRNRVRLISEITHHLLTSEKRNASIDLSFDESCKCSVLDGNLLDSHF